MAVVRFTFKTVWPNIIVFKKPILQPVNLFILNCCPSIPFVFCVIEMLLRCLKWLFLFKFGLNL